MDFVIFFIYKFAELLSILIIIRVVMSWFRVNEDSFLGRFVVVLTDPFYRAVQKIFPSTAFGPFDFTPLLAYLLIYVVQQVLLLIVYNIAA